MIVYDKWKIKKTEHFDNFSTDINIDKTNGEDEDRLQSDEEMAGEGEGKNPNPKNPPTVTVTSHQQKLPSQGSTVVEANLPVKDIGEWLKISSEPELINPQQTENMGKKDHSQIAEDSRKFRINKNIFEGKAVSQQRLLVGQKCSLDELGTSHRTQVSIPKCAISHHLVMAQLSQLFLMKVDREANRR